MFDASIAPLANEVKSAGGTPAARADDLGRGRLSRPEVLGRMPASCRATFAAIAALVGEDNTAATSVSEIARITRFSRRQVRRALTRLEGAHLIHWRGAKRGRGAKGVVKLLWKTFPQKKWASKPGGNNPVRERTSGALYNTTQRYNTNTKERHLGAKTCNKTPSPNWKSVSYYNASLRGIPPSNPSPPKDAPLWPDVAPWLTRSAWSRLAGQVRRRAAGLWGPSYGAVATDAILSTAARAARAGLVESEDELRELIRYLGGRLRESGHAIEILRDRPRAFAFLGGVARRWLRRRGKLEAEAPGAVAATDWPKWQEVAFEVLEELSWSWERRSKPLGDVSAIVAKVREAWLSTSPERLRRRGWQLVEAVSLRGFDLEESRWLVIAGLASALGVPMPEPPRCRDPLAPTGVSDPEAQRLAIRKILAGLVL